MVNSVLQVSTDYYYYQNKNTIGALAPLIILYYYGRVALWLATCAWKSKVPGSSPAASYVQR